MLVTKLSEALTPFKLDVNFFQNNQNRPFESGFDQSHKDFHSLQDNNSVVGSPADSV